MNNFTLTFVILYGIIIIDEMGNVHYHSNKYSTKSSLTRSQHSQIKNNIQKFLQKQK